MFYRKISKIIEEYFESDDGRILCIDGARQIGKSFIVRELSKRRFKNYIELNMADDFAGERRFSNVRNKDDFYLQVSISDGNKLGSKDDTIIFIDEIQIYPELLTLLKSLSLDGRYRYICSGSELGLAMSKTTLIPMGSIREVKMYPMDFEEFLLANSVSETAIGHMRDCFLERKMLDEATHQNILYLFKCYLFVGGLPDAVKAFVEDRNVFKVKQIQSDISRYYGDDASKYDREHKLKIKRIYEMLPSVVENKVKRIRFNRIDGNQGDRYDSYQDEFEYLTSSGIALCCKAITEPKFPLLQSSRKNLLKLYLSDVGLLSNALYGPNVNAILNDRSGVNLGAVYETASAQELKCHGHELYYYDRKKVGEVDFLVDDYDELSIIPIEIKSGSDERNYKALPKLIDDANYRISKAFVFSNEREVTTRGKIILMPIYYLMFI